MSVILTFRDRAFSTIRSFVTGSEESEGHHIPSACPTIAQITLSSVDPCLSLSEVDCCRVLQNGSALHHVLQNGSALHHVLQNGSALHHVLQNGSALHHVLQNGSAFHHVLQNGSALHHVQYFVLTELFVFY
jgi:hypothetical protein